MRRQRISILMTSAIGLVAICMIVIGGWGMFSDARSQTLSNGPQEKVSAGELAAAIEAQKQADAKLTRGESAERRFQELSAILQLTAGTTPVIVQLAVAFRPEGEIQQEAERLAQRAAIRQAQDELLNSVFGAIPRRSSGMKLFLPGSHHRRFDSATSNWMNSTALLARSVLTSKRATSKRSASIGRTSQWRVNHA